jgi:hypothetical protein
VRIGGLLVTQVHCPYFIASWRATIAAGALFLENIKHYYYSFQMPNATRQARRAAGAKRTLYAVACTR